MPKPNKALVQAIAVTAELTGTVVSVDAARVMAEDLARYPETQVLGALVRCRRELKGRLTIGEILSRLDDGRPGPEEAWAMLPKTEDHSVVWTEEMAHAFSVAGPLLAEGESVAARMAFKEVYASACQSARDAGTAVHWTPSLGHDPALRASALEQAVRMGRISQERANALLPPPQQSVEPLAALAAPSSSRSRESISHIAKFLPSLRSKQSAA